MSSERREDDDVTPRPPGPLPLHGHPLHTRSLTVEVDAGDAGHWRVRGEIIDLRKCGFVPMLADIQPAGIVHQMRIELDLDADRLEILGLETSQPHVAIEATAKSGGESCRDPAPRLQGLVGSRLDAGFRDVLRGRFGGPLGCSHLMTLFETLAAAIPEVRAAERDDAPARRPGERIAWRSVFVDGVEAGEAGLGLGVQLSDYWTRPAASAGGGIDRLARCREARVAATIERPGMLLAQPTAAVRTRTPESLASARWRDRDSVVAFLDGLPVLGGVAGRAVAALDAPDDRLLLDAVLQLAPGTIQVMAAVMERWLPDRPAGDAALPTGDANGMLGAPPPDSCWMWRRGGPLARGLGRESDD